MKQYEKGAVKQYRQVWLWLVLWVAFLPYVQAEGIITTIAGNGTEGFSGDGGPAINAQLDNPRDIFVDRNGNLYISDSSNHLIRKIDTAGNISTVAGNGNGVGGLGGDGGPATNAQLNGPTSVAVDGSGNLYIADTKNNRIRKVDVYGIISTVVGNGDYGFNGDYGPATEAALYEPTGIAVDGNGNLYIADIFSDRIRKVDTAGIITTVAGRSSGGDWTGYGDGEVATNAWLGQTSDVAVDNKGNLYIASAIEGKIRKVDSTGIITTVANSGAYGFGGDGGLATNAKFRYPSNIAIDGSGNLYIADTEDYRIRKVDVNGIISTVAGNGVEGFSGDDGPATEAQLDWPNGVAVDGSGNLYIADSWNHRIRKVTFNSTIANQSPDGLIAYYPFDGNALDKSGHGNDGVARETVSYANGKFGQAAQFTDGYIEVPNIKDFTFNNQSLTFSVWTTVAYDDQNIYIPFVSLGGGGGDLIHLLKDRRGINSGKIEMVIQGKAAALSLETGNELVGKYQYDWLHVVGVVDYENHVVKLYLNGQLQSTAELKDTFQVSPQAQLFIGYSVCCTKGDFHYGHQGGLMDDVRIYNRALTDKEIQQLNMSNQPPIAQFTATPTQGIAPLTVSVDASSSSDSDGSIYTYLWSVNGQLLTGKTISITLEKAGDYPITLMVTDDKEATATKTDVITVRPAVGPNQPPKADYYASPTGGQAPLTVTLDASLSSDSDGSIVSYQWSVNGQILTGKTVTVTLEKAGDYPITLTVTDDKGATGNKTYAITVSQPAVTAPKIRIEPTALNFDNTQGVKKGLRNASDLPVEIHKIPSNQELFVETGLPIEEQPADPTITRLRKVGINLNALSQTDATFGVVYTEKVTLNLFPEMSYTVNNTAINYRGKDDYTWIGKIDGTQFGDVILVVKDGRITGNVNAQGEVYRIRPSKDGLHVIQKMNPAAFPEDAPSPPSFIPPGPLPSDEEQRSQSRSARGTRDSSPPIIDVMVVYTPVAAQTSTSNMDIVSEIQLAVEETNQAYANSAIKQRLRLVHMEQVNYTESGSLETDLKKLESSSDGYIDNVHSLRNTYKADLVSLWVSDGGPYCGMSPAMFGNSVSPNFAVRGLNVIVRKCATSPQYSYPHELGHIMGAHHAMYEAKGEPGAYSYSHGYVHDTGDDSGWRTIMAYENQCTDKAHRCPRIPYFSNPDIMYNGVATGDASAANNALTLNNTADIVASFRDSSNLLSEETKKFTIYNDGDADLVVSTMALESNVPWIAVSPKTATLSPKGSTTVNVKVYYTLAPSGQSTSRLLVSSNDSTNSVLPVNIVVNHQIDTAATAPADVYDGDVQSLSVTAQAGGGTYQAVLNPITLQASVIGSIFGIGGYTPVESGVLGEAVTTYDPLTGIVRIPIGSTYLPTGEPVLFEVEMKETSPGIFEITNFLIIPVQAIE